VPKRARRGQKYTKSVNRNGSQNTGRVPLCPMLLNFLMVIFQIVRQNGKTSA
jgi:hypothetical protein